MITKYGIDIIVKFLLLAIVVNGITWASTELAAVRFSLLSISVLLLLFTLYFFRDPRRTPPEGDGLIISPADGKVVLIQDVADAEFLKGNARQVSIFLSPLDVHVNRFPVTGTVQYFRYVPGKYLVAFDPKSSEANERTHIGIENGTLRILFKQIAGFIARRIVAEVNVGMDVTAGARFGMIKFGSRVDVLMPVTCDVKVRLNERVVGGETVLAVAN